MRNLHIFTIIGSFMAILLLGSIMLETNAHGYFGVYAPLVLTSFLTLAVRRAWSELLHP